MMKSLRHILLCVLALAALTVSCVDPLDPVLSLNSNIPDDAILFSPRVLGITPATKTTPGVTELGENAVTRIDVFVYETTGGGSSQFKKHYQIGDGNAEIDTGIDYLLESNWRSMYTEGVSYRIYAIANINANKLNDPILPESPTEAQLKVLTSESAATIKGQYNNTCYDIVRLKNPDGTSPASGSQDHHIGSKLFLMDGKIDNWQINRNAAKQYFTVNEDLSFELHRAAAKFSVELDFSDDFKESLGEASDHNRKFTKKEYWDTEKKRLKTVRVTTIGKLTDETNIESVVSGGPLMKFANFMTATYDVAPEGKTDESVPNATQQNTFRDNNLWDSQSFYEFSDRTPDGQGGYTYPYSATTYSYAFSWEAGKAAEKAPALAVSVVYTTYTQQYADDGVTKVGDLVSDGGVTNYYRIPLVDITKTGNNAINSVERNYYYQIWAYINTMGTSTTDIEPMKVNLKYKVIPWPDAPDLKTEAQTTQLLYFVPEKEYRLRGEGEQWIYLDYYTPKSDPLTTINQTTYYQATPLITNIKVYYYNQNGQKHYLGNGYSGQGVYTWTDSDADVTIKVIPRPNGGGQFYVSSKVLANRSVKYIEFDAVVDFTYANGQRTEPQHITVTHFPLDNIQSITGWWSSRWNGSTATSAVRTGEFSYTLPTEWGSNYETETEQVSCDHSTYRRTTGSKGHNGKTIYLTNQQIATIFGVPNNGQRNAYAYATGANSVESAKEYDGKYYWVTRSGRYTYTYTYYVADEFWYSRLVYYHTKQVQYPSTGNWVAYDPRESGINQGNSYSPGGGNGYTAMVYDAETDRLNIRILNTNGDIGGNAYVHHEVEGEPNNVHMYVIQISKADTGIKLGRPQLDNNYQSNDNVVSPAFMIASQLGVVSSGVFTASTAALHCHDYMEVATNGRRFVGWRLPTKSEIDYIVKYQNEDDINTGDVFQSVLTGNYYYTLDNSFQVTFADPSDSGIYVRCIRDLTPEEVLELNEKGEITSATYSY